jgi:hypothetical protein
MEEFMSKKKVTMVSDNKIQLEELKDYYKTQENCKDAVLTDLPNGTFKLVVTFTG